MNIRTMLAATLAAGGVYTVESAGDAQDAEHVPSKIEADLALYMLTEMEHSDGVLGSQQVDALVNVLDNLNRLTVLSQVIADDNNTDLEKQEAIDEATQLIGFTYTVEAAKDVVDGALTAAKEYLATLTEAATRIFKSNASRMTALRDLLGNAVELTNNTDDEEVALGSVKFSPVLAALLSGEKKVDAKRPAELVKSCLAMAKQITQGGEIALGDLDNAAKAINPFFIATAKAKFGTPPSPALTDSPYWNIVVNDGTEEGKISSFKFLCTGHADKVEITDTLSLSSLKTACSTALSLYPKVNEIVTASGKGNPVKLKADALIAKGDLTPSQISALRSVVSAVVSAEKELINAMINALGAAAIVVKQNVNSNHS